MKKQGTTPVMALLKGLLQAVTIRTWANAWGFAFPEPDGVLLPDIDYIDIFEERPEASLADLTVAYLPHSNAIQRYLTAINKEDPNNKALLTSCILGYFLERCRLRGIPRLIIIDNLDQLPTSHIRKIINTVDSIASRQTNVHFLIPLRPSSMGAITTEGYTANSVFTVHYAPCCFEMIYRRITRYILSRSRQDLCSPSPSDSLPSVFYFENTSPADNSRKASHPSGPSDHEVDILLFISYMFANILIAGMESGSQKRIADDLHPNHRPSLERVILTGDKHSCI
ncbi:MAG: hypothetical protein QNK25_06015 [Desulfobacterales bacterium]|nr:hypothetical protein [Desulfobacterales bacterium]